MLSDFDHPAESMLGCDQVAGLGRELDRLAGAVIAMMEQRTAVGLNGGRLRVIR